MDAQEYFRSQLMLRFTELKSQSATYSLRRFAKDLGQNPAAVSQILNGKRNVSRRFALQISERIGFTAEQVDKLRKLVFRRGQPIPESDAPDQKESKHSIRYGRSPLGLAHYDVVAEWHYYAILSLAETTTFRSQPGWIAKRIGISRPKAAHALERLEKLGLLVRDERKQLKHAGILVTTPDEVRSLALRRRHGENLESARASLYRDPRESRDFTFLTMAINPSHLAEAKRKIRHFENELSDFLGQGERTEVYEICIQLFPRTQLSAEKRTAGRKTKEENS